MSRFVTQPTAEYRDTVAALRALDGLANRAYADAMADHIRDSWRARSRGLRQSTGAACISRLLGKHCNGRPHPCQPPGADHSSLWLLDGTPTFYVTHPYGLPWQALASLVDFCRDHALEAHIDAGLSWHFPGWTVAVVIARPGGWRRLYAAPTTGDRS